MVGFAQMVYLKPYTERMWIRCGTVLKKKGQERKGTANQGRRDDRTVKNQAGDECVRRQVSPRSTNV